METKKSEVIEKAAQIILNSGVEALTIQNLATELGINQDKLYNQFSKDDDILLMLLMSFKTDLMELLLVCSTKLEKPETELKFLFKKLYFLFLQKPYYLSIIFDKNLFEKEKRIKISILRIKHIAEIYLTTIIDAGKLDHTFPTKVPTSQLVDRLLSEFRLLMKDEQRVNEMILELKTIKTFKD